MAPEKRCLKITNSSLWSVHKLSLWLVAVACLFPVFSAGQSKEIRTRASYHSDDGALATKGQYYYDTWSEQEVWHGRYSKWNRKGVMILDCYYSEGEKDSVWREYTPDGRLRELSSWKSGKLNGPTRRFNFKENVIRGTSL